MWAGDAASRYSVRPPSQHDVTGALRWCVGAVFAAVNCIGLEMGVFGSFALMAGEDLRSL